MMSLLLALPYLFFLLLGFAIGSFVSVIVYRLPRNKTIVWGRSMCPSCNHILSWRDLLPVFSYVFLGGKCRYCKKKVPTLYPIIELTTGILFTIAYAITLGNSPVVDVGQVITLLFLLILFTIFSALIFIDITDQLLPDKLVFLAFFVIMFYFLAIFVIDMGHTLKLYDNAPLDVKNALGSAGYLKNYVLFYIRPIFYNLLTGFLLAAFFLFLIIITKGKGMGGGDVKLVAVLGLIHGFPNTLVMLFLAFLTGAIVSVALVVLKRKRLNNTIAFGPFLIGASVITLAFGNQLVDFYMSTTLR